MIAIALAYFVCLKASKEGTKLFKNGGYIIGVIILVVSLILAISDLGNRIRRRRTMSRRTRRTTTRPTTIPRVTPPERPTLPRKAIGVIEGEKKPSD